MIARAVNTADDDWDGYAADNFYQILGVPENASRRDIKRAYKAMMKDFHPDLSRDEESTEFCILLNDIYEARRGMCGIGWQPRCSPCRSWAFSRCSHTTSMYTGLTGPSAVASCAPSLLTQLFWSGLGGWIRGPSAALASVLQAHRSLWHVELARLCMSLMRVLCRPSWTLTGEPRMMHWQGSAPAA